MSEADSNVQVKKRLRKTKQTKDKPKKGNAGKPKNIKNTFLSQSDNWTGNESAATLIAHLTDIGRINILQQTKQTENLITPELKKQVMANLRAYFRVPQESVLYFFFRREPTMPKIIGDYVELDDDVIVISQEILSRHSVLKSVVHLFEKAFQEQMSQYLQQVRRVHLDQNLMLNEQDHVIQCAVAKYLFDNNKLGDIDQIFKQLSDQQIEQIEHTANNYLDKILQIIEGGNQYQQYVQAPQVYIEDSNQIIFAKIIH